MDGESEGKVRRGRFGPAKPFARWSEDTERAFLMALKSSGQVVRAAAEIGRSHSAAYAWRKRYPAFAAAWDRALDEGQAEWVAACRESLDLGGEPLDDGMGGGREARWRARIDGSDQAKRTSFLRCLERTKKVREACKAAGMSATSALRLRRHSPEFARAWAKALAVRVPSVVEIAYDRAVNGWAEPVVVDGKQVGERRRYSDVLLRELLRIEAAREARRERAEVEAMRRGSGSQVLLERRAVEAAQAAGGFYSTPASEEETNAALMKRLDVLRRELEAEAEADEGA